MRLLFIFFFLIRFYFKNIMSNILNDRETSISSEDEETKTLLRRNDGNKKLDYRYNTLNDDQVDNDSSYEQINVNNNGGISWYFAVFLIVNAALGAGLLNFAKAFDNAGGILISSLVQLVFNNKKNQFE